MFWAFAMVALGVGPSQSPAPVGPVQQSRCLDLALEHGDLAAQDEDLSVLGAVGPGSNASQPTTWNTAT
jgi:hypothetical protein